MTGFEPATSTSQMWWTTKPSYIPILIEYNLHSHTRQLIHYLHKLKGSSAPLQPFPRLYSTIGKASGIRTHPVQILSLLSPASGLPPHIKWFYLQSKPLNDHWRCSIQIGSFNHFVLLIYHMCRFLSIAFYQKLNLIFKLFSLYNRSATLNCDPSMLCSCI